MLKRFVARLLIVLQIYGNLFQGVAHASDLADSYPVHNEIHLHSFVGEDGMTRLAIGTNRNNNFGNGSNGLEILDIIDIPKFEQLINPDKELKLENGLHSITEVDEDNLSEYSDSGLSTDDEDRSEFSGITHTSKTAYLTLQGLKIYIDNTGAMIVEGVQNLDQENHRKPIFLSSVAAINLDGVTANAIKLNAPQLISSGTSVINYLRLGKLNQEDEDEPQNFTNYGTLKARELFLNNLNSDNQGMISASHVEVRGEVDHVGQIKSDKLFLSEAAFLRLGKDSRVDIKTLFLSKTSHFENHASINPVSIGILDGLGGSLTNLGTMVIDKMEADSAFQSITNRHFLDIALGSIKAQQFENHGTLDAGQSDTQVANGQNLGALKAKSLQVKKAFTNTETGSMDTPQIFGSGHLRNHGLIETQGDLDVDIKRFTNAEEARIVVAQVLGFDQTTFVINQGNMVVKAMTLFASKTTQNGQMTTTTLNLTGGGEFENLGDIDVDQDLNLEGLDGFINKGNMSTKLINGYQKLITLRNDSGALFKVRDGPLELANTTALENGGTIESQLLNLNSDQTTLLKSGILKALSISLTGVNPFTNSGQIIADHLMATNELVNHGQLVTHRSTQLTKGLTIAVDAVADLKGLKLIGGEIINQGSLKVIGIDPTQDTVIKLTNSGVASIDNGQLLPKASEHSPENLARIATTVGPVTWENYLYSSLRTDHEFENQNGLQAKISASKYLRLFNALSQNQPYVYDYAHKIDPAITNLNGLVTKQRGSSYKKAFIERYQKDVVRSTTEGSLEEQAELQQYLKQFEPHYKQIFTARTHYAKTLHPAMGAALVVESSSIPAVKLQLLNQTPGKLTLKSGRFEFIGNNALVNNGSLIQDGAYTLWLTSTPGDFSQGVWQVKGSLGLLGYVDAKFADLEVKETLFIDTKADALKALASLANVKATKVSISALGALGLNQEFAELYPTLPQKDYETELFKKDMLPKLYTKLSQDHQSSYVKYIQSLGFYPYPYNIAIRDAFAQAGDTLENWVKQISTNHGLSFAKLYGETERQAVLTELAETFKITYPWALEILLSGTFTNAFNVSAPELKVKAQSLKTSGNLFSTQAVLELVVAESAEISASIGGQAGVNLSAKKLKLLGRADIPGAVRPNVFYKRNDNGLYAQGPVVLNIAELLDNQYGVIQGSSYTIKAPQLINLAGLITATDPSLSSTIAATEIKNLRDEQRSYLVNGKCGGHASMNISAKNRNNYNNLMWCDGGCNRQNTTYETSDEGVIFAQGDLTLNYHQLEMLVSRITSGGKLTLISGDKQFTYENAPDIKVLPGTTTMTVRNLHGNHVVAKQDLHVELGNANLATSMQGQNIFVKAGMLTLQSLGLQNKSRAKIVNLLSLMQGDPEGGSNTSNIFKTIGGSDDVSDYTDLTLPFKHQSLPTSLVMIGEDARSQLNQTDVIDLQATMRALEQAMGSQIYTLYRGINGLGLHIHDFFKATSDFVRSHKDTVTQRRSIKSGEITQEIDVDFNATLTKEDVSKSGIVGVFTSITQNINALKSEDKALDDISKTKKKAEMLFVLPKDNQTQPGIYSPGVIDLTSAGNLEVFTNVRGLNVSLVSEDGTLTAGSAVIQYHCGGNSWQVLDRTSIEAVKTLVIAGQNIHFKAINTHSGEETRFISKGNTVDEAIGLASESFSYHADGWSRDKWLHQSVSTHSGGGSITSLALGEQHLFAPSFDCKKLVIEGLEKVNIYEVHDSHEHQSQSTEDDGGWFGGTTTTQIQSFTSRSKGASLKAESVEVLSGGDINITNTNLLTPITTLESVGGVVRILHGTNSESHSSVTSSKDMFLQSTEVTQSRHRTFTTPTITGEVVINSKQNAILQKIYGQTLDYANRIKIEGGGRIVFENVHEHHEHFHIEQSGPTAAFAAVVAIGISIATAGAGSGLGAMVTTATTATMGATTATVLGLMTTGAFMGVCSQAGMALLQSKGDIGKAAKILASSDSLKKISTSIALAGLTGNGCSDISLQSLCFNVARNTVGAGLNKLISNEDFGKGFKQGIVQAGINNITGYFAEEIGNAHTADARKLQGTNDFTQISSHTVSGAVGGGLTNALTGGDIGSGFTSGATGGFIGALTTKILSSANDTHKQRETKTKVADFTATVAAFLLKQDPNIAYQASNNANVHNDLKHMDTLKALGIVKEGEDVYEGDEEIDPRIKAAKKAYNDYGELYSSLDPVQKEMHKLAGYNAESIAQSAYKGTQRIIAENALAKSAMGQGVSEYERQVILDAAKDAAISAMTWGAITGTLNLVSKTVSTYVAKKAFKEMLAGDVVSSHLKFKTPGTASNSNFMQAINRNVMPVEKTGTYGGYGLLNQGKQPSLNSLAKNCGGSESNAFFKPMMSKDTLNNQIGGSQLGSISEHQTFNQIGSKQVSQSFNNTKVMQKSLKTDSSIKGRLKEAELPIKGKIRFVPDKDYNPARPLERGDQKGYLDKFGNEWIKGPSRTQGQPFEWDVQLSRKGKSNLDWVSRDGEHINVSLDGKITHK